MVDTITYRSTDDTRWGGGQGSDLSAPQIDINFWVLASQLAAIQDHTANVADIESFNIVGDQLFVHLSNDVVLGPYTLPTSNWNFRGEWQPETTYAPFDIITNGGAVYMVLFAHTSADTFVAGASDGLGDNYYGLLLAAPVFPPLTRNIGMYIEGFPLPSEVLLQYVCVENMTIAEGFDGSQAYCATEAISEATYSIKKNGDEIATVVFESSGNYGTFNQDPASPAVTFAAGDILTIEAPASPDSHQQNLSFTLVATLS